MNKAVWYAVRNTGNPSCVDYCSIHEDKYEAKSACADMNYDGDGAKPLKDYKVVKVELTEI